MAGVVKALLDTLLLGYSRIFFAENRLLGAFVLAATLTAPLQGLFGLLGGALSSLSAFLLGMDRTSVGKGIYGFNGILAGLGIGYYFTPGPAAVLLLMAAALLLTLSTVLLNNLLYHYCGLPAMSMPFNLTVWLLTAGAAGFSGLSTPAPPTMAFDPPTHLLPYWLDIFCTSLGAVLFRSDQVAGLVLAVGLLLWSRLALILLAAGLVVSVVLQKFLGMAPAFLGGHTLTFNAMLSALALGGIYTIPGPGSLLMAIAGAGCAVFVLAGTRGLLPPDLSPLALPFNLSVWLVLYSLKLRCYPSFDLHVAVSPGSPDENLSRYRESLRVWKHQGLALGLPFQGRWTVCQGIDGLVTHRGDWRFAYDFQVVDAMGRSMRNLSGNRPEDYFAFGLPVLAPAAGKVHTVIDGIADNEIGRINPEQNWGNCIIIEHAAHYYSCLAHLKQGSVSVKAGDQVLKGQCIAQCGNSGRSPWPHLHFQMQMSPWLGAPTIAFEFSNMLVTPAGLGGKSTGPEEFVAKGRLREGQGAQNAYPGKELGRYFPYVLQTAWPFQFNRHGQTSAEVWEVGVDFYGNTYLTSCPQTTRVFFRLAEGLLTIQKIEGSRRTGLFLFSSVISELPLMQSEKNICWTSMESADQALWPWLISILDIFSLLGCALKLRTTACSELSDNGLRVALESRLVLETHLGLIPLSRKTQNELLFQKDEGLVRVNSRAGNLVSFLSN